jgi:hypothetical protein
LQQQRSQYNEADKHEQANLSIPGAICS